MSKKKVSTKKLMALQPDTLNANKGSPRGGDMLGRSMRRYGAGRSILTDCNGKVIAGNKTLETAVDIGLENAVVVHTTGNELVVVQRDDLDLDRDREALELGIADNRTNEVDLSWDIEALKELEEKGAVLDGFFTPKETEKLMDDAEAEANAPKIPEMELRPFEEYNYVCLLFKTTQSWSKACDVFKIEKVSFVDNSGKQHIGIGRVLDGAKVLKDLCKS